MRQTKAKPKATGDPIRKMLEHWMTYRIDKDDRIVYTIRRGFVSTTIADTLHPAVGIRLRNSPTLKERGITSEQFLTWLEKNAKNVTRPIKREKRPVPLYD
jgi:hypothetical protein